MNDAGESQTSRSFSDKWTHNPDLAFRETLREGSEIHDWILRRNGFDSEADLAAFLSGTDRILDAGCGNGRVTALLRRAAPDGAEIVGIDLVSADVARENVGDLPGVRVEEGDLLADLSHLGRFGFVYCQEVLHHTADPEGAFRNLVDRNLEPGGTVAIYVYRRKAPAREWTDDYIRERLHGLAYEDAIAVARQLAALGRALSRPGLEVDIPAVDVLGIEAGRYDLQRFVYHHFLKCFWNENLSEEENAAVNFDWFGPELAARYEPDEVAAWFDRAGLDVVHRHVDPYGITMWGRPRG